MSKFEFKFQLWDKVKITKKDDLNEGEIGTIIHCGPVYYEFLVKTELDSDPKWYNDDELELVEQSKEKVMVPIWFDKIYRDSCVRCSEKINILSNMLANIELHELKQYKKEYEWLVENFESVIRIILDDLDYEVEKEYKWIVEVAIGGNFWRVEKVDMYAVPKQLNLSYKISGEKAYKFDTEKEANEYIRVNKIENAEAKKVKA